MTNVRSAAGRMHEVLLDSKKCCDYVTMHKQPCRHMVCVFHKKGLLGNNKRATEQTIRKFWPKCFHSDNYLKMYEGKTIRQPLVYTGKYTGPEELRIDPPWQPKRKRGRPKITRYSQVEKKNRQGRGERNGSANSCLLPRSTRVLLRQCYDHLMSLGPFSDGPFDELGPI